MTSLAANSLLCEAQPNGLSARLNGEAAHFPALWGWEGTGRHHHISPLPIRSRVTGCYVGVVFVVVVAVVSGSGCKTQGGKTVYGAMGEALLYT
jgi:hypothetical protein